MQARLAGIRIALERHGLAVRPEHLVEGESTLDFGRRALRSLWQQPGPRPTAIICGNDHIALGVLREAEELGIAIPGQLSVTGFDDLATGGGLSCLAGFSYNAAGFLLSRGHRSIEKFCLVLDWLVKGRLPRAGTGIGRYGFFAGRSNCDRLVCRLARCR
ncbi:hypothetical protein OKW43_008541 [Paraburkholderia sp. WC7.3g]